MATRKRFIFHSPCRTLEEFRPLAEQAARLRPHGQVVVVISAQTGKDVSSLPRKAGCGWHDYAVTSPGLHRFFPHPKLEPFMDMAYVQRNQALFLAKAQVLQDLGLEAAWWGVEPHFFPDAFFEAYPHLRGPRCDHPRRSLREEFSICPDHPEGQDIIAGMVQAMREKTPNLGAFIFKTNDAGGTLCWAAATYDGPNGPRACQNLSPGQHVANYVNAVHRGALAGGGDVPVYVGHSNFWNNEIFDIQRCLPANTILTGLLDRSSMGVGTREDYPVRGLLDPVQILQAMERYHADETGNVFLGFRASYDRAHQEPETVAKVLDLILGSIEAPTTGLFSRLDRLRTVSTAWAGEANGDAVAEALMDLNQGLREKQIAAPRFTPMYCAGSLRHLTRPLVFDPGRLTPEEEAHFLPYVFNIRESEARTDYIDLHGTRITDCAGDDRRNPALLNALAKLRRAAGVLEAQRDGPEGAFLFALATSIRIFAHLMRSSNNFYLGQKLRDRHRDAFTRQDYVPAKQSSEQGDGEVLLWKELQRDELDNTTELIRLLEERDLEQFGHATDPQDQDSFTFGPDIITDLKKKAAIMRKHWLDVERYLAPPHK